MTEHEKYKRMFSVIKPSTNINLEDIKMNVDKKSRTGLIITCVALAFAGATSVVYATNFAGIQEKIEVWFRGEKKEVEVEQLEPGHFKWSSEDGHSGEGGGVAYDTDGNPRPITAEEYKSELESPEVYVDEDGITWLCYKDQKVDISEQIANNDGIAKVEIEDEGRTAYITVTNGGQDIEFNYTGFDD